MSSIDLAILGIVLEKPQSAYDIQKDVDSHHFPRWTKISVPSVYRKVLQLQQKGYLQSNTVKGERFADKTLYSITDEGRKYFEQLMDAYSKQPVTLLFDFNVVIVNLNKMDMEHASTLIDQLKENILTSAQLTEAYAAEYKDIPFQGKAIFEQQRILYLALLEWVETFEHNFRGSK